MRELSTIPAPTGAVHEPRNAGPEAASSRPVSRITDTSAPADVRRDPDGRFAPGTTGLVPRSPDSGLLTGGIPRGLPSHASGAPGADVYRVAVEALCERLSLPLPVPRGMRPLVSQYGLLAVREALLVERETTGNDVHGELMSTRNQMLSVERRLEEVAKRHVPQRPMTPSELMAAHR